MSQHALLMLLISFRASCIPLKLPRNYSAARAKPLFCGGNFADDQIPASRERKHLHESQTLRIIDALVLAKTDTCTDQIYRICRFSCLNPSAAVLTEDTVGLRRTIFLVTFALPAAPSEPSFRAVLLTNCRRLGFKRSPVMGK